MTLKPCIECGKECEVLPVQLGDIFNLCYLRVCSGECMFLIAYEFMRRNCQHKQFSNSLEELQNEEDKKERDCWIDEVTDEWHKRLKESLEFNHDLLSLPVSEGLSSLFLDNQFPLPEVGNVMRFTRPSIEKRILWAKEHVEHVKEKLVEAMKDLEKIENESR